MGDIVDSRRVSFIPYSTLKGNARAYGIMMLRDQHFYTFSDIAKEYDISVERVRQIYSRTKIQQIRLYINQVSLMLEHNNTSQIRKVFEAAYECYQDYVYASAYLEKIYNCILTEYRAGEPGMPQAFVENLPSFASNPSEKNIAYTIKMREVKKLSFAENGRALNMTPAKAKHTYDMFYHRKATALLKELEKKAETCEEKRAIHDRFF